VEKHGEIGEGKTLERDNKREGRKKKGKGKEKKGKWW